MGMVQQRITLEATLPVTDNSDDSDGQEAAAAAAAAAAESVAAATAAWSEHAVQLCSLLEAFVRLQASRPAGGALAEEDPSAAKVVLLGSRVLNRMSWHNGGLLQAALAAGPGSPQQAQLFGLLCSFVKYASVLGAAQEGWLTDSVLAAALAAASILQEAAGHMQQPQGLAEPSAAGGADGSSRNAGQGVDAVMAAVSRMQAAVQDLHANAPPKLVALSAFLGALHDGTATSSSVTTATSSSATTATNSSATMAPSTTAVPHTLEAASGQQQSVKALLPWVALFGRCCLLWAQQLLQGGAGQRPEGCSSTYMGSMMYSSVLDIFTRAEQPAVAAAQPGAPLPASDAASVPIAVSCFDSCTAWLASASTSAQLTAAGYDVGSLLQCLQAARGASAQAAGTAAAGGVVPAALVGQLVQQLQAVGGALSSLAISSACNYPACTNTVGSSEAQLVKGSSRTCAGCRTARYCCKECQAKHWKQHKPVCKSLAAAAVAGAQQAG